MTYSNFKVLIIQYTCYQLDFFVSFSDVNSCHYKSANVIFLLDSSGSEGHAAFDSIVQIASEVALKLNNLTASIRFSSVTYSSTFRTDFPLNYYDEANLKAAFQVIAYTGGSSLTGEALVFVNNNVLPSNTSSGQDVRNIVIIFTDGSSTHPSVTEDNIPIIQQKADVIAVGVGKSQYPTLLEKLSSFNTVHRPDIDMLFDTVKNLIGNAACVN